ncbi:MAG: hypothetical protein ACI4AO_03905 [Anaerotignum sp.]
MKNKTSEVVGNIRTAMLVFLIDVNILGLDIIFDFFGWMCLLGAIDILEGTVPSIERIRGFGKVLLWYEIAMVVLHYIGNSIPFYNTISPYMAIFILCIRMYFMYIILTAIADAGAERGGEADTLKKVRRSRNCVLLAELAVYLAAAIEGTENIGGWVLVPFVLYFLFYIGCILQLSCLKEEVENWEKAQLEGEEATMET